jgi:hypothetical protein
MKNSADIGYSVFTTTQSRKCAMHKNAFCVMILLQLFAFGALLYFGFQKADFKIAKNHLCARTFPTGTFNQTFDLSVSDFRIMQGERNISRPAEEKTYRATAEQYAQISKSHFVWFKKRLMFLSMISLSVWGLYPFVLTFYRRLAERQGAYKYVSGPKLIDIRELKKQIKKRKEATNFVLAVARGNIEKIRTLSVEKLMKKKSDTLELPFVSEPNQFLILGSPNQGKSTVFKQLLDSIYYKRARGVVLDPHGEYVSHYYNPKRGDIIFNPVDARGVGYTIFNDTTYVTDFNKIAETVIPPNPKVVDPLWEKGAAHILSALLHTIYVSKNRTNKDLWECVSNGADYVKSVLENTRIGSAVANSYLVDPGSKMSQSYFTVLRAYAAAFEYLVDGDFSIRRFLQEQKRGWIFITAKDRLMPTLKPILTLFVDLFSSALLDLEPDRRRRIYLFLDEFPTLNKIPSLENLPAQSRKFGGIMIMGAQGITQIEGKYQYEGARSILNGLKNGFYFACDGDTAEWISGKRIGEWEYDYADISTSTAAGQFKGNVSIMRRRKKDRLIYPSLISNQQILEAYVQLQGYDLSQARFVPIDRAVRAKDFILREGLSVDSIMAKQDSLKDELQKVYNTELDEETRKKRKKMIEKLKEDLKKKDIEDELDFSSQQQ